MLEYSLFAHHVRVYELIFSATSWPVLLETLIIYDCWLQQIKCKFGERRFEMDQNLLKLIICSNLRD
jgi:hypothetical protein